MIVPRHPEHATGHLELELSPAHERYGDAVGDSRQAWGRSHGWANVNDHVRKLPALEVDRIGGRCEVAACVAYGLSVDLVRLHLELHEPDLPGFDVRGTNGGQRRLLVYPPTDHRPGDPDERQLLLVWSLGQRRYTVVGWAYGWQAKVDAWWCPPELGLREPCWAMPWGQLIDPAWLRVGPRS